MGLPRWKTLIVLAIASGFLSGPIFVEVFSGPDQFPGYEVFLVLFIASFLCAAIFAGVGLSPRRCDYLPPAIDKKSLLADPQRLFFINGLYFTSAAMGALMCAGLFGWGWEWVAPAMIGLGCLLGVRVVDLFR